jgi:hypothetical protein
VAEEAKNRLGKPVPYWPGRDSYHSAFIKELEARRDQENGVPRSQLESRYSLEEAGWRIKYDPYVRRQDKLA